MLDFRVHIFELIDSELLNVVLDDFDTLMVVGKIRSVSFQTDHVKGFGRFQRAMEMEVFSRILGLIQIS